MRCEAWGVALSVRCKSTACQRCSAEYEVVRVEVVIFARSSNICLLHAIFFARG